MTRLIHRIETVFLFFVGVILVTGATTAAEEMPPPSALSDTVGRLIAAAASPSGFALLGKRGPRVEHLLMPPLPNGYVAYPVNDASEYVIADRARNTMALVWDSASREGLPTPRRLLRNPLRAPADRAAEVEKIISPYLGKHYSRRALQMGMLFTSPGRPTVEFVFVPGLPQMGLTTVPAFRMAVIVFPPHAAVLQSVDPCGWWLLSTPPPGWGGVLSEKDCKPHWARIAPQP